MYFRTQVIRRGCVGGIVLAGLSGLLFMTLQRAEAGTNNPTTVALAPGQTATLLPGGQQLILGGRVNDLPTEQASLFDPSTGKTQSLSTRFVPARAGHTATMLPDGRILILGGRDSNGNIVNQAQTFDPQTQQFVPVVGQSPAPRDGHAATLQLDGRVLIVGGTDASGLLADKAALWDPRSGRETVAAQGVSLARIGATPHILADGTVLYLGGSDRNGQPINTALLYRPSDSRFQTLGANEVAQYSVNHVDKPQVAASLPVSKAENFPSDGLIAIRFSSPVDVTTINTASVTLFGRAGPVAAKIVPAERGSLVFVVPTAELLPGAPYTLFLDGIRDTHGQNLDFEGLSFSTASINAAAARPGSSAQPTAGTTNNTLGRSGSGSKAGVTVGSGAQGGRIGAPPLLAAPSLPVVPQSDASQTKKTPITPIASNDDEVFIPNLRHRGGHWRTGKPIPDAVRALLDRDERYRGRLVTLRARESGKRSVSTFTPVSGTGIAGTVLRLNDKPLANVVVSIGAKSVRTDANGRFVLTGVPVGHQELVVDGSGAGQAGSEFAQFILGVEIKQGLVKELTRAFYLPRIQSKDWVNIASPTQAETVVTHPDLPGLELRIPKGAVIRDRQGKITTRIGIVPVPLDRAPFTVPANFPIYFMIQPAGAVVEGFNPRVSPGVRIIYPNYTNDPPGTPHKFWLYDPRERGWFVYGTARVSRDGKQIVPDPGVGLHEHMAGGHVVAPGDPAPEPPVPTKGCKTADPVDCNTGVFLHERTDVLLRAVLPVALTRTYRPGDSIVRPFGIGTTHNYEMYIHNPNYTGGVANPSDVYELVLPDGARINFVFLSGTDLHTNYVWEHTATPGRFYRARMTASFSLLGYETWRVTLTDGTIYELGPDGHLIGVTDRHNNHIEITRNGSLVERITSDNGRYIDFTYDVENRISTIVDIAGRTWNYTYNVDGYLDTATYPDGSFEKYTYDPTTFSMTTVKDRRGNTMATNVYDANGRVSRQTLADGGVYQFAYTTDANGKVTQTNVTDPRGIVRRYVFHPSGYPTSITDAFGTSIAQTTTYERSPTSGHITAMIDALGHRTEYVRDTQGNVTSITRMAGTASVVTERFTYEPRYNQLATYTDPLGHTTTLTYDSLANLAAVTDPLGNSTNFTYNAAGQILSITSPMGAVTTMTYDIGDLVQTVDPLGRATQQYTDILGRVRTLTDPQGRSTRYDYDLIDRLTQLTDALGQLTKLAYDNNGNLLNVTDPKLAITKYAYDAKNRRTSITNPLNQVESLQYDGNDNIVKYTDRKAQATTFTYDFLNRQSGVTYADASSKTKVYDAIGRLTQVVDSKSGTITRGYDAFDRLTTETTPQGGITYGYDAAGRRTALTVSGQPALGYVYDNANRLTQMAQGSATVAFTYDPASRRTTLTLPSGIVANYAYDTASQLTSINYKRGTTVIGDLSYSYDAVGQRTSTNGTLANASLPAALSSATYDAANRLTTFGTASITYDANGNMLTDGTRTYTWDARNHLATISGPVAASFQYDAFGRRISRTIAAVTTKYLYDNMNPVQELTGTTPSANLMTGLGIDEIFRRTDSAGARDFIRDALGSTLALADNAGVLQTQYAYDPFGRTTTTGATSTNSFQYTGRENDGTGLYFYRARYYAPDFGRFISSDPIGLQGGLNTYRYAEANPIRYTDALGLASILACGNPANAATCIEAGIISGRPISPVALPLTTNATPKQGSKPKNCPAGTLPIDEYPGLDRDDIHDIKDGVGAGPADWTGIAPNGDVITGDANGNAQINDPYPNYLP